MSAGRLVFDCMGEYFVVGVRMCAPTSQCVCVCEEQSVGGLPLWIFSIFFSKNDIPKLFHFSDRKWRTAKDDLNQKQQCNVWSVDTQSNNREILFNKSSLLMTKHIKVGKQRLGLCFLLFSSFTSIF